MKKAIFLMCVCAMTLCCVSVIAQERSAKEIMVGATKAVKEAVIPQKTLKIYLTNCNKSLNTIAARLKKRGDEYQEAIKHASTDSEKNKLSAKYLKEKQEDLDAMLNDFKYANEKIKEKIVQLNAIVGKIGKKSAIVKKAETAAKNTSETKKEITNLQMKWRSVDSEKPEHGTDEWVKWFQESNSIKRKFMKKVGKLNRSIRQAVLYEWLGKNMKMSKVATIGWQQYSADLSVIFEEHYQTLITEKEITSDYLVAIEAGSVFNDMDSVAEFANGLPELMGKILGSPTPLGTTDMGKVPTLKAKSFDIKTFNVSKYQKEQEAAARKSIKRK